MCTTDSFGGLKLTSAVGVMSLLSVFCEFPPEVQKHAGRLISASTFPAVCVCALWRTGIPSRVCSSPVPYDGLVSHPVCAPTLCPVLLGTGSMPSMTLPKIRVCKMDEWMVAQLI